MPPLQTPSSRVRDVVKLLRGSLASCDAQDARTLWKQAGASQDAFLECHNKLFSGDWKESPDLGDLLDALAAQSTVPGTLVALLHRLLVDGAAPVSDPPRSSRARNVPPLLAPSQLTPASFDQCSALGSLLGCLASFVNAALTSLNTGATLPAFCRALAAARPCAAVAAACAQLPVPATTNPRTQHLLVPCVSNLLACRLCGALLATDLLTMRSHCKAMAGLLDADVRASHLAAHACACVGSHLEMSGQASPSTLPPQFQGTYLGLAAQLAWAMLEAAPAQVDSPLCPTGICWGGEEESLALVAEAVAEPQVARFLLQALALWRRRPGCSTEAATLLTRLLYEICLQPDGGAAAGLHLTAADVLSIVPDSTSARDSAGRAPACLLLSHLLQLLSPADRHRAFQPVAAFAERAVDETLLQLRAQPALAHERPDVPQTPGMHVTLLNVGPHEQGAAALLLLRDLVLGHTFAPGDCGFEPVPNKVVAQHLRSRARWCLQRGLVGKCETILRSTAPWPALFVDSAAGTAATLAALVASSLVDDPQRSVAARGALASMLATVRKVTSNVLLPAPAAAEGRLHALPTGRCGPFSASMDVLDVLGGVHEVQGPHDPATPAASRHYLLLTTVLQLLAPALRYAAQHMAQVGTAVGEAELHRLRHTVWLLAWLHECGFANCTAALAGPAFVEALLRVPLHDDDLAWVVPVRAVAALFAAGPGSAWRLPRVARLSLPDLARERLKIAGYVLPEAAEALQDCSLTSWTVPREAATPQVAAGTLPATAPPAAMATDLGAAYRLLDSPPSECDLPAALRLVAGALTAIQGRSQVLMTDTHDARPPITWDSCLLGVLSRMPQTATFRRSLLFVGCCRERCTELAGDSEAALPLRMCAGCRLTRYCSITCQRKAWWSGHRAACQAWQEEQKRIVQTAAPGGYGGASGNGN